MKFLERFTELIKENNLTISEVAKKTELPRSTISSYVNRKSIPSAIQLEAIAKLFNCSIDYLMGIEDDFIKPEVQTTLSYREQKLLKAFNLLEDDEKDKIIEDCEYFANKHIKTKQQRRA